MSISILKTLDLCGTTWISTDYATPKDWKTFFHIEGRHGGISSQDWQINNSKTQIYTPTGVLSLLYPNINPEGIYRMYNPGLSWIKRAHAFEIAACNLINIVTLPVFDLYIEYWYFQLEYIIWEGYITFDKFKKLRISTTWRWYNIWKKKWKSIISYTGSIQASWDPKTYLPTFIDKLKKNYCNTSNSLIYKTSECKKICGNDPKSCQNNGIFPCIINKKNILTNYCQGKKYYALNNDDLRAFYIDEYELCKNTFTSPQCYEMSMNSNLPQDIKEKWDSLWISYCKKNPYSSKCACFLDPDTMKTKYAIDPSCLTNCRNPEQSGAYQPWFIQQNLKNSVSCPDVCAINITATSNDVSIIKNIKIIQNCSGKNNKFSKTQLGVEFKEQVQYYVNSCALLKINIISYINIKPDITTTLFTKNINIIKHSKVPDVKIPSLKKITKITKMLGDRFTKLYTIDYGSKNLDDTVNKFTILKNDIIKSNIKMLYIKIYKDTIKVCEKIKKYINKRNDLTKQLLFISSGTIKYIGKISIFSKSYPKNLDYDFNILKKDIKSQQQTTIIPNHTIKPSIINHDLPIFYPTTNKKKKQKIKINNKISYILFITILLIFILIIIKIIY